MRPRATSNNVRSMTARAFNKSEKSTNRTKPRTWPPQNSAMNCWKFFQCLKTMVLRTSCQEMRSKKNSSLLGHSWTATKGGLSALSTLRSRTQSQRPLFSRQSISRWSSFILTILARILPEKRRLWNQVWPASCSSKTFTTVNPACSRTNSATSTPVGKDSYNFPIASISPSNKTWQSPNLTCTWRNLSLSSLIAMLVNKNQSSSGAKLVSRSK